MPSSSPVSPSSAAQGKAPFSIRRMDLILSVLNLIILICNVILLASILTRICLERIAAQQQRTVIDRPGIIVISNDIVALLTSKDPLTEKITLDYPAV